ncbi:MAG: aminodeoxychorismate synthase, component I [Omnitrophica bacterium RBG_13_46_9]|nr:MAG: aminodeoxychorismate synthase, component I [Omnitrophica bacterium RBG_13_46_9]
MIAEKRRQNLPIIEKIDIKCSPVSIYALFKDLPYSSFLDSALNSHSLGRFSFIGMEPFLVFKSKKDRIILDWTTKQEISRGNPFIILKGLFEKFRIDSQDFPFPFIGGGIGYFSYELKDFNESLPDRAVDDINIPDCIMCFYDCILAFDHFSGESFIISSGLPEKGERRLYRRRARLENVRNRIYALTKTRPEQAPAAAGRVVKKPMLERLQPAYCLGSNFTKDSYLKAVENAKEYIKAGDIYQVNLSQRFKVPFSIDPFDLYSILRTINPAPFACFLNFGDVKVVSASPERFLKKDARRIQTRPIKGTRPRGKDGGEDARLKEELISSAKDKAENLMIIDLERNDLGRICEYGSVRVTEFMACEKYATVFHLVSTIEGQLRGEIDSIDCLINCFPGGSITGAPKIRSMEIIEELEPVKRSIYTGSVGYISFNDNMDTSIVIRTFIIKGNETYFQVGGGIVYDSDPEKEYQETLDKAKALIEAVSYSRKKHSLSI